MDRAFVQGGGNTFRRTPGPVESGATVPILRGLGSPAIGLRFESKPRCVRFATRLVIVRGMPDSSLVSSHRASHDEPGPQRQLGDNKH